MSSIELQPEISLMECHFIVSHARLGTVTWNEDRPTPLRERGAGNTVSTPDYFLIPSQRVVELGTRVEI
jgi:K+ transporter